MGDNEPGDGRARGIPGLSADCEQAGNRIQSLIYDLRQNRRIVLLTATAESKTVI